MTAFVLPVPKEMRRGLALRAQSIYAADFPNQASQNAAIANTSAAWCYNYLPAPDFPLPPGVDFVPMIFDNTYATPANLAGCKQYGIILGPNEPDQPAPQANMTPAQCVAMWPLLEATGCRLGAPCPTDPLGSWMTDFLSGIGAPGYTPRVDFFPLHHYTSSFGGGSAEFLTLAKNVIAAYGRPVWFTEMGSIQFSGTYPAWTFPTVAQAQSTLKQTVAALLTLPNRQFERYCWYPCALSPSYHYLPPGGPITPTPAGYFNDTLTDTTGALTALGTTYRDVGFS